MKFALTNGVEKTGQSHLPKWTQDKIENLNSFMSTKES